MAKTIFAIELDPDKDVAKVPAGAIPRGIVAAGDNIRAVFEAEEGVPMKAVEFLYPMAGDTVDLTGFNYVGTTSFADGENICLVYAREM